MRKFARITGIFILQIRYTSLLSKQFLIYGILAGKTNNLILFLIPIGQLSEEAQEARNKESRRYREQFTRKTSRIDTNTDLLHILLISSDPLISSYRKLPQKKLVPFHLKY